MPSLQYNGMNNIIQVFKNLNILQKSTRYGFMKVEISEYMKIRELQNNLEFLRKTDFVEKSNELGKITEVLKIMPDVRRPDAMGRRGFTYFDKRIYQFVDLER